MMIDDGVEKEEEEEEEGSWYMLYADHRKMEELLWGERWSRADFKLYKSCRSLMLIGGDMILAAG
jgi:hypothetical protein